MQWSLISIILVLTMLRIRWTHQGAASLAVLISFVVESSTAVAQIPSTPPRDFSKIQSYSGTVKVSGSGSRTETQGRASTTENATLEVAPACLPGPPDCLAISGGGAFLLGPVNGPIMIDQEHVLFQPFGPPTTGTVRGSGIKTGSMTLVVSPFTSVVTTIPNTYGFQYDHSFQCQTAQNGVAMGSDTCYYGPKIPSGESPLVGPSIVGNVALPAFGFNLSGSVAHSNPADLFGASYNVQWNLQCDARTLTVPVLQQNVLPWRTDLLNNKPGKTIWGKGCALTSLAMALNFAGVPHTPRTLNQFLIENGGYSAGNGIIFTRAVDKASAGRMKFMSFRSKSTRDIEDVLCMGFPVIVFVGDGHGTHYVIVTGKQGSKLVVKDPVFPNARTLDQYPGFETRGFVVPRDFSARRPGALDTPANAGTIVLQSDGNDVEMMIVDAAGKRTGFDPTIGAVVEEIAGAVYFEDAISDDETPTAEPQVSRYLQIDRATAGAYQVVVTGRRAANYSISVSTYAQDGSEQAPATIQGTAQIGASVLSLQYTSATGGVSQVGAPGCAWVNGSVPIFPTSGGTASLTVTGSAGCTWTATSDSTWLLIAAGGSGSGNGTVNLQVLANSTNMVRTGKVRVAGLTFSVTQRRTVKMFDDVAVSNPFFDAINLVLARQITTGCRTSPLAYCGDAGITRGQMAVFIVRSLLGDNFVFPAAASFADVPAGPVPHPFFKYIQKMKELGITSGCTATNFCPDDAVTRGQMAVFLMRAKFGAAAAFPYPATAYFRDSGGLHPFYNFIQKMRELGVTSGCSATEYCPDAQVTRGQMAIFLMRGLFNEPGI